MGVFTWTDSYRIGNETIDLQHQRLFELANRVLEVKGVDEIRHLLMSFYQHVREHFKDEENYMKQTGYPGYREHLEEHNRMLDRLIEISETVQRGKWDPSQIKTFVDHWIMIHVLEKDMVFAQYLKMDVKS